eukprot:NODE_3136_length_825_cov_222.425974.p1 GENE.NODE_3136_length_825_cov_222.425974~~NODE_3136_length_825_cov_222.425974.p1  ORF type:complete len:230 (-),score=76.38 NODE_3136_length_825_cov_222.425974:119-715(-)
MAAKARYHHSPDARATQTLRLVGSIGEARRLPQFSAQALTRWFHKADIDGDGDLSRPEIYMAAITHTGFFWVFCGPMVDGEHLEDAWRMAAPWYNEANDGGSGGEGGDGDFNNTGAWPTPEDRQHMLERCLDILEEIAISHGCRRERVGVSVLTSLRERQTILDLGAFIAYFKHFGMLRTAKKTSAVAFLNPPLGFGC